jgi:toxin ParE1/3/4
MKKYRYQIRPQAEADLDDHARAIAQDNLGAALRLYDLAAQTYKMLCDMPQIGVVYHTTKPDLAGVRYIPIKEYSRYLIFYKADDQTLDIIRVLHDRMDRDGWL